MKLHSLTIQAFGPFAKKEVLDFSALGENALFLIDGPTGAGKSSILHAICYALYGETTDSDRKELGLRCDHAGADLLTELSLEFSIRDVCYRISRVPTQMRPSKRGGGETEQKATAHLRRVLANGEEETLVAKKTREADAQIEAVVGLTAQQFLQVMVLPQGKFRALLVAKSDDRQTILSTLFQTEIYKRIEQLLKDKAGEIEKQHKLFEDRKSEALADVNVADIGALQQSCTAALAELQLKTKQKEAAANKKQQAAIALEAAESISLAFTSQENKQKSLLKYQSKAADINADKVRVANAEKANFIAPKWLALQSISQDINDKNNAIKIENKDKEAAGLRVNKAKQHLDDVTEQYQQRDGFKAEEVLLNGYQQAWQVYQSLNNVLFKADKNYSQEFEKRTQLIQQLKILEKGGQVLQDEINTLEQSCANKAEIVEQMMLAKVVYEKRLELENVHNEVLACKKMQQLEQQQYDVLDKLYKEQEQEANRLEMYWFSNQAAVLAAKLETSQPCVVCGSVEHPNPAQFSAEAVDITQQGVNQARKKQVKQLKLRELAKESLQACLHTVSSKEKELTVLKELLRSDASKTVTIVEQSYLALRDKINIIEAEQKKLQQFKQQQINKEQQNVLLVKQSQLVESTLPELMAVKVKAKTQWEDANKALPELYRNSEVIENALFKICTKIKSLENIYQAANTAVAECLKTQVSIEATVLELNKNLLDLQSRHDSHLQLWQQALAESEFISYEAFISVQIEQQALQQLIQKIKVYDNAVTTLQAELALLQQQLKDKKQPDLALLQQQLLELSQQFTLVESNWTNSSQQHKKFVDTQQKIQQIDSQKTDIKKQYEVVGTLSKAASGRGNVRVSLERFVLGNILDQVLSTASQRLYIMSKGQYRLIRQDEENQKRNTTAGLDLAIDDSYTGKTRPVATLSGGESFMASLALALGLSDVVQERSGGVQLDTLFIDEGFGSLDQDSLQLAINTLIDLQSTGRTVGIISHVTELKEQMAQRIEVIGSRDGSRIKMVV